METVNGVSHEKSFVQIKMEDGCKDLFPVKAHKTDAGFDLMAAEDVTLSLNEVKAISVGFKMAMEDGWEAQIRPRSGNALKYGLQVVNSPGTVDCSYRGTVCVIIRYSSNKQYNLTRNQLDDHTYSENFVSFPNPELKTFSIKRGMKIAQMVIKQVPQVELIEVDSLDETERGEGGFGSTDQKKAQ